MKTHTTLNNQVVTPAAIIQAATNGSYTLESGNIVEGKSLPESVFSTANLNDIAGHCEAIDLIMDLVSNYTEECVLEADITIN